MLNVESNPYSHVEHTISDINVHILWLTLIVHHSPLNTHVLAPFMRKYVFFYYDVPINYIY